MKVWVLYMILKEDQGKFGGGEIVWNIFFRKVMIVEVCQKLDIEKEESIINLNYGHIPRDLLLIYHHLLKLEILEIC